MTLGAGGMVAVNATSSAASSVVTVDPTRILDTRTDVGLSGPFVSGVSQKLQVTGTVPTQPPGGAAPVNAEVVPATATAVVLNATVVRPSTKGFLSIRPGDATGNPATSNINWAAGGANIANSVIVQLPASGQVDIFVNGTVGDVLIDIAGYMIPAPDDTGLTTKSADVTLERTFGATPVGTFWRVAPGTVAVGDPAECDADQIALAVFSEDSRVTISLETRTGSNAMGATVTANELFGGAVAPGFESVTIETVCGELPV